MNNEQKWQQKYKNGRGMLGFVLLFSVINIGLALLDSDTTFVFALVFPEFVTYWFRGTDTMLLALTLFAAVPALLLALCYLLSKKRGIWLLVAGLLVVLDTLFIVFIMAVYDMSGSMIINLIFHLVVIYSLLSSARAGSKLRKLALEQLQPGEAAKAVDLTKVVNEQPWFNADEQEDANLVYRYDKAHAKANKVNKSGLIILYTVLFLVAIIAMIPLVDLVFGGLDDGPAAAVMLLLMVGLIIVFCILMTRTQPYLEAPRVSYMLDKDGVLTQLRQGVGVKNMNNPLHNLIIIREEKSCFRGIYTTPKGKNRKIIIPKDYPGLDDLLRPQGYGQAYAEPYAEPYAQPYAEPYAEPAAEPAAEPYQDVMP